MQRGNGFCRTLRSARPTTPPPIYILDVYLPQNSRGRLPNSDHHIHFLEDDIRTKCHNSANLLGPASLGYIALPKITTRRFKVRTDKVRVGIVDRHVVVGWSIFTIDKLNAPLENDMSLISTNYQVYFGPRRFVSSRGASLPFLSSPRVNFRPRLRGGMPRSLTLLESCAFQWGIFR